MHVRPTISQKTIELFAPAVIRAATQALNQFTPPSDVLPSDVKVKIYADAIQNAGKMLGTKIARNIALNAAAHILMHKPWHAVKTSGSDKPLAYSISLIVLGGQHKPCEISAATTGEMCSAAVEQIVPMLSKSQGAVIDMKRTPYNLTLTVTDVNGPSFIIDCHGPLVPDDHVRFTHRLEEALMTRAPTVLLNYALLPTKAKHGAYTQPFFRVTSVEDAHRSTRLVGELDLFELFASARMSNMDTRADTIMTTVGTARVQVAFRDYDEPFAKEYVPITVGQLNKLWKRYHLWSGEIGQPVNDIVKTLKEKRRSPALNLSDTGGQPGEVSFAVSVAARLPITLVLGNDFMDAAIASNNLRTTSDILLHTVRPLITDHVELLKQKIEEASPGWPDRLDKNSFAAIQPLPNELMGWKVGVDNTYIALGYWAHSQEVVGASGRYSAREYSTRIADYNLATALKDGAISTTTPCPCCAEPAVAIVTMLPTSNSYGVWAVNCNSCGHHEKVSDAPDKNFESSLPAFTCGCRTCVARGHELAQVFSPKAQHFASHLNKALVLAADNFAASTPGWRLDDDNMARFGEDQYGRYYERVVHVTGIAAGESISRHLPAEYTEMKRQGLASSAQLQSQHGFDRKLTYRALPALDDNDIGKVHAYSMACAGFDPTDVASFRSWASNTLAFAMVYTLQLPLIATVRKHIAAPTSAT